MVAPSCCAVAMAEFLTGYPCKDTAAEREGKNVTGRRIYERYLCDLSVEILHGDIIIATKATNVSLGGFFLVDVEGNDPSALSLAYGEKVKVRFSLPDLRDGSTTCESVIRWNSGEGLGVQFGSLRAIEVWALNQYFKNLEPDSPPE